ncbi:MAG: hypothetical protein HGA44_20305, partial [Cellulomonadaceae bacterium]|nr:hypothetical protein [Cellulomonadaceae bacterium]
VRAFSGLRAVESRVLVTEAVEAVGPAPLVPEVTASSAERIRATLLTLPKGDQPWVRLAESPAQVEELFDHFSEGGAPTVMARHQGTAVRLPDGTTVAMRDTSKSGGLTIDVEFTIGASRRVHLGDF